MSLITKKPNYSIADGDTYFDGVSADSDQMAINIAYSGINSTDVELYLEQSIDAARWNAVPGSDTIVDQNADSHLFRVGTKSGMFIRVGLRKGSATAGTIDAINYLT